MKKVYLLAALMAFITAVLGYFYLQSLDKREVVQMTDVVVAKSDIPAYAVITEDMLAIDQVVQGDQHELAINDLTEAVGLVSESRIVAGEQLISDKLKSIGISSDGLSYLVENGMRAVSVAVDSVSGIGGFVRQNDCVDVMVTIDIEKNSENTAEDKETDNVMTTMLVAENIKVLAVGTSVSACTEETGCSYENIILMADPADAAKIIFAAAEGRICLLLRSVTDESNNDSRTVTRDSMGGQ